MSQRPPHDDGFNALPQVPITPESTDELYIPHSQLKYALTLATAFNEDERSHKGEYLRQQFHDFELAVRQTPGYLGVFGTGYPFYAWNESGGVHAVDEISRFTTSYLSKIEADEARSIGMWPCAACQCGNGLPDLKTYCRPCENVTYKPRDLFKALPDVDLWVVTDEITQEREEQIEASVRQVGFYTSDENIKGALDTTVGVMQGIANGEIPRERLPADLHIISKVQLLKAIRSVPQELLRTDTPGNIPVSPRSLHMAWEDPDEPYDFLKDFLFSLTPSGWQDAELVAELNYSRRIAHVALNGNVADRVAALAPKEARQLETPGVRQLLEARVANW